MGKANYYIGTSGFSYNHWDGIFYPADIPRFPYYQTRFSTVEINATFYRMPTENTFRNWEEESNSAFIFSLKCSRTITHLKKLKDIEGPLTFFLQRARLLKKKLGVILYQLPPNMKNTQKNREKLNSFISLLPHDLRHAIEFRDNSWDDDTIFELLQQHCIGYCIISAPHLICNLKATTDFIYIRFHGISQWYNYNYTEADLSWWADTIKQFLEQGKNCFIYFNNDAYGYAVNNATRLKELLQNPKAAPPA